MKDGAIAVRRPTLKNAFFIFCQPAFIFFKYRFLTSLDPSAIIQNQSLNFSVIKQSNFVWTLKAFHEKSQLIAFSAMDYDATCTDSSARRFKPTLEQPSLLVYPKVLILAEHKNLLTLCMKQKKIGQIYFLKYVPVYTQIL